MLDSALNFLRKRDKFSLGLVLFFIIGAVFIFQNLITFKKATASNITVSAFTASSYTLSATGVTYTITFTAPADIDSSGYFGFGLDGGFSGGTGADFTGVSITTLTDDGVDISGNVSSPSLNSEQDGISSGFTLFVNSGTIAANSTVVIAMAGITNPSFGSSYSASVGDSEGNETTPATSASQAFGTPMLKIKITEPDGSTPVSNANVWVNCMSMTNYFGGGGNTDAGGQIFFFADQFYGPEGVSKNGDYAVNIEPPSGSEYTRPSSFTVALTEGSTKDCTDSGADCSGSAGNGPILLTRPMAKGKFVVPASPPSTCNAAAGSAIQNVQAQVRNTESMDPSASTWLWSDSNGEFRIGGLGAGTYAIEFALGWGNENYVGLTPPDPITGFVVNANGSVTYNSSTTAAASLPVNFGNIAFQTSSKTITGRVVDGNGNGIEGMKIRAHKMMTMGDAQTATAANGTYGLNVGGGSWSVMPEVDYYANYDDDTSNDVSASYIYCGMPKNVDFNSVNSDPETETGVNFTMKQASATITGTVVDPNGAPVAGSAGINAFSKGGCGGFGQVNWNDGTFAITVPPGTYNLQAQSWNQNYGASASQTITVTSGTTNVGNVALTAKNATIAGRLWADTNGNGSYNSGEGVGNVRVEAFRAARKFDEFAGGMGGPMGGSDWATTQSSNETATKGNFTLKVAKGTWMVNVMADMGMMGGGYSSTATNYIYTGSPIQVSLADDNGSSTGRNFELKVADATINGRLWMDANGDGDFDNGEGVASVYGFAFAEPDGTFNQGPMMGMGMGAPINNGTFQIKVPAGTYRVGVDFPPDMAGYTPSEMATVTVAESSSATVNVPVLENNATIKVQFKDTDGNLIKNLAYAEVFLNNEGGAHLWQMFSSGDLTNGFVNVSTAAGDWYIGYHIDPTQDNYMSEPNSDNKVIAVADGTVTKNITLRAADSTIGGTVYDPNGSPLAGVFISTDNRKATGFDMAGPMFMRGEITGADGAYSLNLPAGTYKVEARFPPSAVVGGQTVNYLNPNAQEATVSSTSPATVNFTFGESDATITGTITLDGSNQGAFISAYSDKSGYNEDISTNGSYSLNVTKDDTWHVRAMYETGNSFYQSDVYEVVMGGATSKTQNLTLSAVNFTIPDSVSTTFNCANAKKVTLSNGAEISIPASAIQPSSVSSCDSTDASSNITLTVNPTAQMSLQDKSIPIGVGYEISASDSNGSTISDTFNSNVTITIPYSDTEISDALGGTVDESLLGNGYWDTSTSAWRTVDSEVLDADNNKLTISTNHFTLFGVLAATDPAAVETGTTTSTTTVAAASTGASASGESKPMVSKAVGATVEGSFNRVILMIPAMAVKWDANFEIDRLTAGFIKPKPPLWVASGPYRIKMKSWWNGAEFTDFQNSVTLIVRYDPYALGEIPEKSLRLNYYDEVKGRWRPINSVLIADRHEVAAVIDEIHGTYALIGGFGWQGVSQYVEKTVTAEAKSEEIGLTEEVLPRKEVKTEIVHPSVKPEEPKTESQQTKQRGFFGRLLDKVVSLIFRGK